MERHAWSRLTSLQLGRYAEYLVKMEFALYGFDVYTAEVDNRGIDFVIRRNPDRYYDVQVKSVRRLNYIFFQKAKFNLKENLLAAVALFFEGKSPQIYLIPATVWREPNKLFVSRDYERKKSKPEWGLNLSQRNLSLLEQFTFEKVIGRL